MRRFCAHVFPHALRLELRRHVAHDLIHVRDHGVILPPEQADLDEGELGQPLVRHVQRVLWVGVHDVEGV